MENRLCLQRLVSVVKFIRIQRSGYFSNLRIRLLFRLRLPRIQPNFCQCFYVRNYHAESCYCRNWKVTPVQCPFFHKILTPDPGRKEKRRIMEELIPALRIHGHLCFISVIEKKQQLRRERYRTTTISYPHTVSPTIIVCQANNKSQNTLQVAGDLCRSLHVMLLLVYQCWTWSGFRIAIQPDSAIQNRIRIGLDFEKTQPDQIWISKLHWSLQYNA